MQGKLIAVVYTLRTRMDASVFVYHPRRIKTFNFDDFENSHDSFLRPEYFIDYFCENGSHGPCQALTSVLCSLFRPKTVHCSTENAYTSEITFLALVPWLYHCLS